MIESDELDKFLVQSEKELEELGKTEFENE